jgi:hypothetical protein
MNLLKKVISHHYFWLLLILLVAYWPITFQQIVVPHDMINVWVPWRHFISDTIQNGDFPWWNPYQQMGYPIHADLQGPSWHLESLLASLIGRQGPVYIQFIMLFYIWLGGVGIYKLSSIFTDKDWIKLIAAVSYICSGFFTNHSMHLFSVISGAMVPHIIFHFIQLYKTKENRHAIIAAIFTFFNLTGGNQTFTILTFYLLAVLFIYFLLKIDWKNKAERKRFILNSSIFGAGVLSMGAVIFTIFLQMKPYLSRLSNMTFEAASIYPFTFKSIFSYLNPMVPINESEWIGTDGTMSNAYFGLVIFGAFLLSFFIKKTKLLRIFLVFGLFCFVLSFGANTFFYQIVFEYFPLLNKFRFPAYYNYFFMISAIALGVATLDHLVKTELKNRKLVIVLTSLGLLLTITVIYGLTQMEGPTFLSADDIFYNMFLYTDRYQNFFFYGIIQLLVLGGLLYAILTNKRKIFVAITIIELMISVQPNLIHLGVGGTTPQMVQASLDQYDQPYQVSYDPIVNNTVAKRPVPYTWMNVNHLHKTVSYEGFNSNYFSVLGSMVTHHKEYADRVWSNPVVYMSDNIIPESDYLRDTLNRIDSNTVIVKDADYDDFIRVEQYLEDKCEILTFEPNYFKFSSYSYGQMALHVLQSHYPGWNVYIDGEPSNIYKTNAMFMSVIVPPGEHVVEFRYENTTVKIAGVFSYLSFLVWIGILIGSYVRRKRMAN